MTCWFLRHSEPLCKDGIALTAHKTPILGPTHSNTKKKVDRSLQCWFTVRTWETKSTNKPALGNMLLITKKNQAVTAGGKRLFPVWVQLSLKWWPYLSARNTSSFPAGTTSSCLCAVSCSACAESIEDQRPLVAIWGFRAELFRCSSTVHPWQSEHGHEPSGYYQRSTRCHWPSRRGVEQPPKPPNTSSSSSLGPLKRR